MSKQIDERIVEMKFENAKFEKNVAQTMNTIDKLKEKLAFKNANDGFDKIQKAADKVSFEHLVRSVDDLKDTISNRTSLIDGVFEELGSRIVQIFDNTFGKVQKMINQVTFEPIATGFSEYELKINSVQTIAANTGVLMQDVMGSIIETGEAMTSTSEDLETAWEVINGVYGTGAERVEALGDRYDRVQKLVNQIVAGEIKMGDSIESTTEAVEKQNYTMADIEKVLDDLNEYADKTIYNYANMTDAIGKFTVAGVDLMDSASAVQGIANLAAFVGADATSTSRIMRELAQGLNTGFINLQDWRSLENSPGFSGTVFQEHLVDMAEHLYTSNEEYRTYIQNMHGEIDSIQQLIDYYGNFRNSLTDGRWLSSDVLIDTLHEFAGDWGDEMYAALGYTEQEIADIQALGEVAMDAATKSKTFTQMWDAVTEAAQSSWTTTWEYIFGHFYDARNLWTDIGDELSGIVGSFNESRNAALSFWAASPFGREKFLKGMANIWNFLKFTVSEFSDAWQRVWGTYDIQTITKWSAEFEKFTRNLSSDRAVSVVMALAKAFEFFIDTFHATWLVIKGAAGLIWDFLGNLFNNVNFDVIYGLLSSAEEIFDQYVNISALWYEILHALDLVTPAIADFIKSINYESILNTATKALSIFQHVVELVGKIIVGVGASIIIVIQKIFESFGGMFSFDEIDNVLDLTDAFVLLASSMVVLEDIINAVGSAADKVFAVISPAIKMVKTVIGGAVANVKTWFGGIFDWITTLVDKIKSGVGAISNPLENIKEWFVSIGSSSALKPVVDLFKTLFDEIKNANIVVPPITSIAAALAQLFLVFQGIKSLKNIRSITDIFTSIPDGISDVFDAIQDVSDKAINFTKSGVIITIAKSLLLLAISLGILALIPSDKLKEVSATLVIVIGGLMLLMKVMGGLFDKLPNNTIIKGASAMALLAISIGILVGSIALLTILDYQSAVNSLVIIGVLMIMIGSLIDKFNHARFRDNVPKVAVAILIIVQAVSSMAVLIAVLSIVAKFNSGGMWQAFGVISLLLLEISGLYTLIIKLPFTGSAKSLIGLAASIMLITGAVILLSALIAVMSIMMKVNEDGIWKAFGIVSAILGALVVLSALLVLVTKIPSINPVGALALAGSVSIIIFGLIGVIAALFLVSLIQNDDIWKPMLTLLGVIALIGVLVLALSKLGPGRATSILAAAVAINMISFAILTMAQGVAILSTLKINWKNALMILGGATLALAAVIGLIALIRKVSGAGTTITRTTNIMFGSTSPIHKFLFGLAAILLAISISIWVVVDAVNRIMDAADRFNNDDEMADKMTEMFKGLAQAFADSWKYIRDAVNKAGIGNDLDEWFDSFLVHLVQAISNLLSALVAIIGVAAESIADALIELLNGLAGTDLTTWYDVLGGNGLTENIFESFIKTSEDAPINKLINAVVAFIALVIYGVGDAIINNAGPLVMAIAYLITALGYLEYYILGLFIQAFSPEIDMDTLNKYFSDFGQNYVDGWVTTWNTVIKPGLQKLYDEIASHLRLGICAIGYAIAYAIEWVINNFIIDPLNNFFKLFSALLGLKDRISIEQIDITSGIGHMMDVISGKSEEASNAIDNTANSLEKFNAKMNELSGKNVESTVTLNPMFATDTTRLNEDLFTAGDNAGKESVKGFNNAWDIHSPSVVGEQSGKDIGAGVVNGISGYFNSPEAQDKLAGIKDSLPKVDWSGLYDSATANFDVNPSQVVDFDMSKMGDGLMQSPFGDKFSEMNLNMGNVSTDLANVNNSTQDISEALANEGGKFYDDTDVVNELSGLRDDISSLSRAMTQIKMYLDGNKLVGELVGPLDNALAQRASRAQRGN